MMTVDGYPYLSTSNRFWFATTTRYFLIYNNHKCLIFHIIWIPNSYNAICDWIKTAEIECTHLNNATYYYPQYFFVCGSIFNFKNFAGFAGNNKRSTLKKVWNEFRTKSVFFTNRKKCQFNNNSRKFYWPLESDYQQSL